MSIENDLPGLDVNIIEAKIMSIITPLIDPRRTDKQIEKVSVELNRTIRKEFQELLKEHTGVTTNYKRKLAMRRAVTRFGGNCRTCVHYTQLGVGCKPTDPEVLGCSYYAKDKSKARSGRKPSED